MNECHTYFIFFDVYISCRKNFTFSSVKQLLHGMKEIWFQNRDEDFRTVVSLLFHQSIGILGVEHKLVGSKVEYNVDMSICRLYSCHNIYKMTHSVYHSNDKTWYNHMMFWKTTNLLMFFFFFWLYFPLQVKPHSAPYSYNHKKIWKEKVYFELKNTV